MKSLDGGAHHAVCGKRNETSLGRRCHSVP